MTFDQRDDVAVLLERIESLERVVVARGRRVDAIVADLKLLHAAFERCVDKQETVQIRAKKLISCAIGFDERKINKFLTELKNERASK